MMYSESVSWPATPLNVEPQNLPAVMFGGLAVAKRAFLQFAKKSKHSLTSRLHEPASRSFIAAYRSKQSIRMMP